MITCAEDLQFEQILDSRLVRFYHVEVSTFSDLQKVTVATFRHYLNSNFSAIMASLSSV